MSTTNEIRNSLCSMSFRRVNGVVERLSDAILRNYDVSPNVSIYRRVEELCHNCSVRLVFEKDLPFPKCCDVPDYAVLSEPHDLRLLNAWYARLEHFWNIDVATDSVLRPDLRLPAAILAVDNHRFSVIRTRLRMLNRSLHMYLKHRFKVVEHFLELPFYSVSDAHMHRFFGNYDRTIEWFRYGDDLILQVDYSTPTHSETEPDDTMPDLLNDSEYEYESPVDHDFGNEYEIEVNDGFEDQMHRSAFSEQQLELINIMVENEGDRTLCKKILKKANITSTDVLNVKRPIIKKFVDNCENYGIKLECTLIGVDVRPELIQETKNILIQSRKNRLYPEDYVKSNWLCIDQFLTALKSCDKGEQHRACKTIVHLLNDKWCATFYHNSNNACRQLILKFKNLNIESNINTLSKFQKKLKYYFQALNEENQRDFIEKYEDEMFSFIEDIRRTQKNIAESTTFVNESKEEILNSIRDTTNSINRATESHVHATNDFSNAVNNFNINSLQFMRRTVRVMDNCEILTAKFIRIMDAFEGNSAYISFFLTLLKFVSFGYLVTQKHNQNASSIAALISLILPTGIGSLVLSGLSRAVTEIIRYYTATQDQINSDEATNISRSFSGAFLNAVGTTLKSIFVQLDPKSISELRANTFFIKTIADLIRSCTTIVDFLIKAIGATLDYIISCIMEYYGMLPSFLKDTHFNEIIDEFVEMKKNDVLQKCGEDIVCAGQVIVLREKVLQLEADMNKSLVRDKTLMYKVAPYIRIIATTLEKAYDEIPPMFKGSCNAHRVKPFFVLIHGPPRIGKSKIFQPILVNELAKVMGIIDSYQDPQHYCCFRTAGREFWDGGQGKKVIWYNDIFQGMMNENGLDLALEELASVVDDNPYHMNMSDVKDKARHYLTAPLVVANAQNDTTNAGFLNSRLWSHGAHLSLRRDICVQLELAPHWKKPDGSMDYEGMTHYIEKYPDHCYGAKGMKMFPNDFYIVTFLNTKDGTPMFTKNFGDAIAYICDVAKVYIKKQDIVTSRLIANMKALWDDQMYGRTTTEVYESANEAYVDEPDDDEFSDATEFQQFVRPARQPRLTYNPSVHDTRSKWHQKRLFASNARKAELYLRERELYRPQRRKYKKTFKTSDGKVYEKEFEDVLPEDTNVIRDGSTTGSFYTHMLSSTTCHIIAQYMTSLLSGKLTNITMSGLRETYRNLNDSIVKLVTHPNHKIGNVTVSAYMVAQVGFFATSAYTSFITNQAIYARLIPYTAWIVQTLLARNIHRTFKTIEDIIIFGFQNPEYYYENFIDFVYNQRDSLLHMLYETQDFFIDSYYAAHEFYEHITMERIKIYGKRRFIECKNTWDEFKENAKREYTSMWTKFKEFLNKIPGWAFLVAGAAVLASVSYVVYKMYAENEPQSHEGNMKAKKRRVARKLNKRAEKTSTHADPQAYDNTNNEIEVILRHSYIFLKFETQVENDVWVEAPLSGMALNVKSNIFVMPFHYWYRFQYCNELYRKSGLTSRLKCTWSAKEQTVAYFDAIEVCNLDYGHTADVVYIRIKNFNCGRDISHFFVSDQDDPNLIDSYLYGYRPRGGEPEWRTTDRVHLGKVSMISEQYDTKEIHEPILGGIIPQTTINFDICYHYTDCLTGAGDCTMVLMHTDSHLNAKILGIHVAGNKHQHTGLAAPIYREDINEVTEFFNKKSPVISLQVDTQFTDYTTQISHKADKYMEEGFNVVCNTGYYSLNGKVRRIKSTIPSQNKVQHSIVHERMEEDFGPTTVAPTALAIGLNETGEKISPFFKAFKKLNNFTKTIPHFLHEDLVESCSQAIISWPSQWNKQNARLLTWDEAINGYMNLKGIDMTTSSGFPFTLQSTNKKKWFNFVDGKWFMNKELQSIVEEYEIQLQSGKIPNIYFIDTLKDELRPIEKVKDFKTRMFQVGSMAWTILFRKYFGWFMGHCQSTYEFGEMMSGINPNSYDWDLLAKRMLSVGDLNDNGDYGDYDSTLCHQACTGLSKSANFFYSFGESNPLDDKVRDGLILGSINTFHIVEDFIIMRRQGNPSGFLLTTVINNYCNMYYNRYAFLRLTKFPLNRFRKYICAIFFGDDKNAAIHKDIQHLFNTNSYAQVMKELGLKYTTATKKEIQNDLLPIEEISFLKRKFVYDKEMHIWKSQLDHDVIMEIPRWSESDPTNVTDQMNRFNSCLMELTNYSKEEFNYVRQKFVCYIVELMNKGYNFNLDDLFTYHYCCHLMYPKHFPSTVFDYDLATVGKQQQEVVRGRSAERNLGKLLNYTSANDDITRWDEQMYVANSENLQEYSNFNLTRNEVIVLRKRIVKAIRASAIRLRPVIQRLINEATSLVLDSCPCPGTRQVYTIVAELVSSGELWNLIRSEVSIEDTETQQVVITSQPNSFQPEGIDDDAPTETQAENQTISTFIDINEMHMAERIPNHNIHAHRVFMNVNIESFLTRPFIVDNFVWTSTMALYEKVVHIPFPYALTNQPAIASKLQNVAWWSPDVEITIRANTTVFHYGTLGFQWIPQTMVRDPLSQNPWTNAYGTAKSAMNSKTWTQLEANSRQVLRFIVPYTHYKNKITIGMEKTTHATPINEDLFTLFGYVTYPLLSAQAATVAPVNVTIYARFVNPRLEGYHYEFFTPQGIIDDDERGEKSHHQQFQNAGTNWNLSPDYSTIHGATIGEVPNYDVEEVQQRIPTIITQRKSNNSKNYAFKQHVPGMSAIERIARKRKPRYQEQGDAEAKATTGGLVSSTMLAVADFVGKFSPIPYIGAVAAPISAITAAGGYFAKWMGFSVANTLAQTEPMQIRNPWLVKCEDAPMSVPLAPDNGLTVKSFEYVNSYPSEMSIIDYISTPGLLYTGQVLATHQPGHIVWEKKLSPREMVCTDYMAPNPGKPTAGTYWYVPTYVHTASTFAQAWRGSFKFDIVFKCTQFHSCRLAFIYVPYKHNSTLAPNMQTYTNAVNALIDIQANQTFSFLVPFDQSVEWLDLPSDAKQFPDSTDIIQNSGTVYLMVVNELTSVISTPMSIGFQVFVTPCSDFQFLAPYCGSRATGVFGAQGIDDVEECDYPSSSLTCLKKTVPVVLGGAKSGYRVERIHHSCELTSFRQLCNMITPLTATTHTCTDIKHFVWGNYDLLHTDVFNVDVDGDVRPINILKNIQNLFRYHRGGVRLVVATANRDLIILANTYYTGYQKLTAKIKDQTELLDNSRYTNTQYNKGIGRGYGSYYTSRSSNTPVDIIIPFCNRYKCVPTFPNVKDMPTFQAMDGYWPDNANIISTIVVGDPNEKETAFLVGAADDYILGWTMPCGVWHRWIPEPEVVNAAQRATQSTEFLAPQFPQMRAEPQQQPTTTTQQNQSRRRRSIKQEEEEELITSDDSDTERVLRAMIHKGH